MPSGEFELIYRYFASLGSGPGVALGVGDDAALLQLRPGQQLVTSVDTLLADVHFPEDAFPEDIAYRAVAVAASDLAAMGAEPLAMTLALSLPEADEFWLHSFSQGLAAASRDCQLPLVGGDTTRGGLAISVNVMGQLPEGQALLRSGARPGEYFCVSGSLGDGAGGLAVQRAGLELSPEHAEYLWQRFYRPQPELALGMALRGIASAAIDVSDGLLADAGHIAAASGVRIVIDAKHLPLSPALTSLPDREVVLAWALSGGDDYRLAFTLPSEAALPEGCSIIGEVTAGEGVDCPAVIDIDPGYQHF